MTQDNLPDCIRVFADTSTLQATLGGKNSGDVSGERGRLLLLAEASDMGFVEIVTSSEAQMELDEPEGDGALFFGARLVPATMPQPYRRALATAEVHGADEVADTLAALDAPRFAELRDMDPDAPHRARLFNALHFWCAEESGCEALLNCDAALRTQALQTGGSHLPAVGPGELLEAVGNRIGRWRTLKFLFRGRKRVRRFSTGR